MKEFNTTGTCIPEKHYMVDISDKLERITTLVDKGRYFTINRPRQYGKTTTLFLLSRFLGTRSDYLVLRISFESIDVTVYQSHELFIHTFLDLLREKLKGQADELISLILDYPQDVKTMRDLSKIITGLTQATQKKVVLIIDEVDKSSNNQLFLDFLGVLRDKYLIHREGSDHTFHCVILAGVVDVKSLKIKIRPDEEPRINSPWNIAVDLNVDLSFSPMEIKTMLVDYQQVNLMKMDLQSIADCLYYYTSGYPFLVSRLCQIIDENLLPDKDEKSWEVADVDNAVKRILQEKNTNFDSLIKNLENSPDLYKLVSEIVLEGVEKVFNRDYYVINMGEMYGIFREEQGKIKIHNRIYEQRIYNYLAAKVETLAKMSDYNFRHHFIKSNGNLDLEKIVSKFQEFMKEEYNHRDRDFLEQNGRLLFLAFLKPIINGQGFDFKEVQISEEKRLDVVVTYANALYVVELKIWRGEQAHERGLKQLQDYLDRLGLGQGYLVIYDFRKSERKDWKKDRKVLDGKEIVMVWV